MIILKILISFIIPTALILIITSLLVGCNGGYRNDKLNYFCIFIVIGGTIAVLLSFSACIVYDILFCQ